ncbi:MAG: ARMT1-like domain-containing protein [Bacillota bacterium]|nr:ARMT1-like domain-containing protein [Bacillota bacterium]
MKVNADCVHCYLKQAVSCMNLTKIDEDMQHEVLFKLMDEIKNYSREKTPAENSTLVLLKTYELIDNYDPYKAIKRKSNDLALNLYPKLQKMMDESEDKLDCALRIAVAGNVIDLGINRDFDISEALRHSMEIGFSINHLKKFKDKINTAKKIMIIGDNSGEIVFDKILTEHLKALGKDVVYVVKEKPILNDATMEDAIYTGMDKVSRVITNGSGYLGTCIQTVSKQFLKEFHESDVVLAKGQANYESLENEDISKGKVFFLLRAKCDIVAESVGVKLLDMVFLSR